jgi:hypothetical protein
MDDKKENWNDMYKHFDKEEKDDTEECNCIECVVDRVFITVMDAWMAEDSMMLEDVFAILEKVRARIMLDHIHILNEGEEEEGEK